MHRMIRVVLAASFLTLVSSQGTCEAGSVEVDGEESRCVETEGTESSALLQKGSGKIHRDAIEGETNADLSSTGVEGISSAEAATTSESLTGAESEQDSAQFPSISQSTVPVPPPSPTLQCVISLSLQYFIVYTLLAIFRTINQFTGHSMIGWQKVMETACTTVTYAPSLSALFLGCRMRAIQLSAGQPQKYGLPQPWAQTAMYCCTYAVLAQVILVVIVAMFTGEAGVTTDDDGNIDMTTMRGAGILGLVLTVIRYLVMAGLYGGFGVIVVGIHMMEPPKEIWGAAGPPVSPAVACTINLTTQFFVVYLLVALSKTAVEINGPSLFLTKLEGLLKLAKFTVNFVPMLCVLFIGARLRALQMDPKGGNPQWWAQYCFYFCTYSVLVQTLLVIIMPFCTECECKQGTSEGDVIFTLENKTIGAMLTLFRYLALLALYGGFTAVCVSVYVIEHPTNPALTPPISPAMQCVMNLTVQYFSVYLMLFVFITCKQFGAHTRMIDILISVFDSAQKTVMFAPMLATLFIGIRMRALQLIMGSDNTDGQIPVGAGPQSWAQDAMFLCTWSVHVQLIMTILVPLVTGSSKVDIDDEGHVKVPEGASKIVGIVLDFIRWVCLISMYGGAVTIMVAVYYMTPDTLPPKVNAGQLIPGLVVPKPPTPPTKHL